MRTVALLVVVGCSRESSPPEPQPMKTGGSYSELVTSTQSGSATETRTELACSKQFVELAKVERRPVKTTNKHCKQADIDARLACFDKREKALSALAAPELWNQADATELVSTVTSRLLVASDARAALSATERELLATYLFDGEVRNGGVHQFFFNSSGDDALETRAGLVRFGMTRSLALFDCALTAFPANQPSQDRAQRNEQLARWGEKQFEIFDTITDAFYVVDDDEWQRVYPYVRDHRAEFPNIK